MEYKPARQSILYRGNRISQGHEVGKCLAFGYNCRGGRILVWMRSELCLMVAEIRLGLLRIDFPSDYIGVVYIVNY